MGSSVKHFLGGPVDEAVDARRDEYHSTFIPPDLLGERWTAQSYRPEVVAALVDLRHRHHCFPLRKFAARNIRQGVSPEYGEGGPPCVKLKDVRQIIVSLTTRITVSGRFASENQDSVVRSDAVFINRSGGFTIGRAGAYLRESELFVSDDVFAFLPAESCDAAFIACYLNSWWGKRALEAGINGSTGQLKLSQSHVRNLPVPGFSLEIQRAIGNKVRKAERLLELAKARLLKGEQLLSSRLSFSSLAMTGPPFSWTTPDFMDSARADPEYYQPHFIALQKHLDRYKDRCISISLMESLKASGAYGVLPSSDDYGNGDLPFLRAQDVGHYILEADNPIVVPRHYSNPKAIAREGDLLLEVKGQLAGGCLCPPYADGWLVNGSVYRIRLRGNIDAGYVLAVLLSPLGILQKKRSAANNIISYISIDFLDGLQIPRLRDEEEREIGECIRYYSDTMINSRRLVKQAKAAVESLIDGTLDEGPLRAESVEIEVWLKKNPSPKKASRSKARPEDGDS